MCWSISRHVSIPGSGFGSYTSRLDRQLPASPSIGVAGHTKLLLYGRSVCGTLKIGGTRLRKCDAKSPGILPTDGNLVDLY